MDRAEVYIQNKTQTYHPSFTKYVIFQKAKQRTLKTQSASFTLKGNYKPGRQKQKRSLYNMHIVRSVHLHRKNQLTPMWGEFICCKLSPHGCKLIFLVQMTKLYTTYML